MKQITVVTPCYNEASNLEALFNQVAEQFLNFPHLRYEHLFIDNASTDGSTEILRELAAKHPHVKVIINARNFGWIRSPFHALQQTTGDATLLIAADLQDPPEMITRFVQEWEAGYPIVLGVKTGSEESPLFFGVRKLYYYLVSQFADIQLIKNFTGFGLYDRKVVAVLKNVKSPYPYLRGLVSEIGFPQKRIEFKQPQRKRDISKSNFFLLYDAAMLGFTSHTKLPLRLATMAGVVLGMLSFCIGMIYLVYKLLFWNSFPVGMAPVVIGLFFFSSVQLFFIGLLGEYILSIHTHVKNFPLVVESERINFEDSPQENVPTRQVSPHATPSGV